MLVSKYSCVPLCCVKKRQCFCDNKLLQEVLLQTSTECLESNLSSFNQQVHHVPPPTTMEKIFIEQTARKTVKPAIRETSGDRNKLSNHPTFPLSCRVSLRNSYLLVIPMKTSNSQNFNEIGDINPPMILSEQFGNKLLLFN